VDMIQASIDLNCDLGEYDKLSQGTNDEAIMTRISSCNIACGAHAGNQQVIDHTIALAIANQVNIGAHPSYPDRLNFGRQVMHLPAKELHPILRDQITTIHISAQAQGGCLSHVKPHGALYNQAAIDLDLALLLAESIAEFDQSLLFYGLAHSTMAQAAKQVGVGFVAEGFADRGYTAARNLQPRGETGALIDDVELMLKRVLGLLQTGQIETVEGASVDLIIDTLCLHGDHVNAMQTAQFLSQGLQQAGFSIQAPQTNKPHVRE